MPPIRYSASLLRRQLVEPRPHGVRRSQANGIGRDAPVEHELAAVFGFQGFCEQIVQLEHFDTTLLHLQHEVVVVLLRLVHPQHVVEQKILAVAGREPLVREPGPTHHHRAQLANFRVNAECRHADLLPGVDHQSVNET